MNRIKYLRTQNGWTQEELAKMLSVQNAAISKYETGRVPLTDETLKKLSKIFNCSADYILGISDAPTPINKKANDTVDEPIFITMQSFYKELPVKDQQKMDRVLKTIFEEMFPKNKDDNKDVPK